MKMQMYKCCCWSLKTGVLIFGIFEFFRYLFIIGGAVIDYDNLQQNYTKYENYTEYKSYIIDEPELLYFYVPACFIMLVFSSLMIFGSQKNKYKFMIPHFYAHIFIIISYIINQIYCIVLQFFHYKEIQYGLFLLAKGFVSSLFDTYCCFIVFSRIKEIKKAKNNIYPLVF